VTIPDQPDIAEQGRRAMGKLIEEGVDLTTQLRPIVGEAVTLEHVATQPAPQLLDRSEPGRVGRRPDWLQIGSRRGSWPNVASTSSW
jgi:hypothetical protein